MNTKNCNTYHKLPILDGLELLNAKNHTTNFPFHTHDTFNVALILNQTFNVKLVDRFLQAPVGTLSITNPHEVHATPCDNKIGNSFFTFYISPEILKDLNDGNDVFFENKTIYDEELFKTLYHLSVNLNKTNVHFEKTLLLAINKLVKRYSQPDVFRTRETSLFKRFIEEETFKKFSLTDTANNFGINKYKFLRLFKQETGLTPNAFVISKRIEKCKRLLQTESDLLEIAIETGFYDATHLCRYFKRFTGVTPYEYKRA